MFLNGRVNIPDCHTVFKINNVWSHETTTIEMQGVSINEEEKLHGKVREYLEVSEGLSTSRFQKFPLQLNLFSLLYTEI